MENLYNHRKISFNSEAKQEVKLQRKGQILMQNDYLYLKRSFSETFCLCGKYFTRLTSTKKPQHNKGTNARKFSAKRQKEMKERLAPVGKMYFYLWLI